ncbi:hypothetical protein TNCV_3229711 [Trichonephila clavipes]|nr:hypothetical protein TNCV_3229711 [Trichonephila clavipes]
MVLELRREGPCADQLRSPIRDYWRRKRGPPWGFKKSTCKLTRAFILGSLSIFCITLGISFFLFRRRVIEVVGAAAPQGSREKNYDDLRKTECRSLRNNRLSEEGR